MERARAVALTLARRIGDELALPVFLYGELGAARGPAFFRTGGPTALQQRMEVGELAPDRGPARLDPSAGAVLVGARRPLIAFNVNLQTDDLEVARAIAAVVRERGGGFPGVRALGFALPSRGLVQVSMNVEDPGRVALHEIVARVHAEAAARSVETAGSELVGLLPAGAAAAAARADLGLDDLDESRLLEVRLLDACESSRRRHVVGRFRRAN
jgi:glutamate formiminotransferase / 5-formyltetrahydrofolate cyclo-ligase